jgi:uncharacterized Ntn-hydrolase superfamily protein
MKNIECFLAAICSILFLFTIHSFATFSICAVDTVNNQVGSAGASCIGAPQIPQGCLILSDVHPGVGVVHTQASYLEGNQNLAKGYMNQGDSPDEIVDKVVDNDVQNNPRPRQYGVVDLVDNGRSAGYSGSGCQDYKGHILGKTYAIQGNILLGKEIIDSMESRFLETEGTLADKLMAALQGAKVRGADTRCYNLNKSTISAFLRVAKPDDPDNDLYCDLNVSTTSGSTDPIDVLQGKYDDWLATNIKNKNKKISHKVIVSQNYPNPFTKSTTIRYSLLKPAQVVLKVYNTSGQEIKTLVNKNQSPGEYNVLWNATNQNSKQVIGGVYIYMLRVGSEVQTYRMLLVR